MACRNPENAHEEFSRNLDSRDCFRHLALASRLRSRPALDSTE
jgi:hypothetical protein